LKKERSKRNKENKDRRKKQFKKKPKRFFESGFFKAFFQEIKCKSTCLNKYKGKTIYSYHV